MVIHNYIQKFLLFIAISLLSLQPLIAKAALQTVSATQISEGTFSSEAISGGEAEGQTLELTLYDDGTALLLYFDKDGSEVKAEFGDWEEADNQITLTITGDESDDYADPIKMVFEVDGESLIASTFDEATFGSDGITLSLDESGDTSGDRVASDDSITFKSIDAVDADGNEITVTLVAGGASGASEGSIELTTENADGESITEVGTWTEVDDDANLIDVTLTGTLDETYAEPVTLKIVIDNEAETFTLTEPSDDRYGKDGVTLEFLLEESSSDSSSSDTSEDTSTPPGIYYTPSLQVDDSGAFYVPLIELSEDGSAQWNTNYFSGTAAMSEVGTWELAEDGTLTITITGVLDSEGEVTEHEEPVVVTFDFSYDSIYNYDIGLYMYKLSLPYDYSIDTSSDETSSDTTSSDEITSTAQYIYESTELADGSTIRIEFAEDGSALVITNFNDGSDDLMEIGEWTLDEATDVLTLTVTGTEDDTYPEPIEWVFDANASTITAVEWDKDLYGQDAPELELVEQ